MARNSLSSSLPSTPTNNAKTYRRTPSGAIRQPSFCTLVEDFTVGDRVRVDGKKGTGTVRFVGETHFQAGGWIGVELDTADGKNDGSVLGVRYFECPPLHGLFVRPASVAKDEGTVPQPEDPAGVPNTDAEGQAREPPSPARAPNPVPTTAPAPPRTTVTAPAPAPVPAACCPRCGFPAEEPPAGSAAEGKRAGARGKAPACAPAVPSAPTLVRGVSPALSVEPHPVSRARSVRSPSSLNGDEDIHADDEATFVLVGNNGLRASECRSLPDILAMLEEKHQECERLQELLQKAQDREASLRAELQHIREGMALATEALSKGAAARPPGAASACGEEKASDSGSDGMVLHEDLTVYAPAYAEW